MSIKSYAMLATGLIGEALGFCALWEGTKLPIEGVIFLSMAIGCAAVCVFAAVEVLAEKRRRKPTRFIRTESGLSVMIQQNRRRA
jgi:hypothetical protein